MLLEYIHWNPDPEIINIFGFSLRYYGILFVTGLIVGYYILEGVFKKEGIPAENLEKLSTYGMIGIIAGARLGHCLFYEPDYYLSHPIEMFLPIAITPDGIQVTGYEGLASHGGVMGIMIALWWYSKKTKHALIDVLDLQVVVIGVALGFIRLANFMNSEIVGMPSEKPWAIVFERIDNIPRHPSQLYEALAYFFIFGVMMFLYKKYRPQLKNGMLFGIATVLFFIARFMIEFLKENQVGFEEGMALNMGQLLSLPYIALGVIAIIYGMKKTRSEALQNN